jgi:hypothetical protein
MYLPILQVIRQRQTTYVNGGYAVLSDIRIGDIAVGPMALLIGPYGLLRPSAGRLLKPGRLVATEVRVVAAEQ